MIMKKKLFTTVLTAALSLSLIACGKLYEADGFKSGEKTLGNTNETIYFELSDTTDMHLSSESGYTQIVDNDGNELAIITTELASSYDSKYQDLIDDVDDCELVEEGTVNEMPYMIFVNNFPDESYISYSVMYKVSDRTVLWIDSLDSQETIREIFENITIELE